MRVESSQSDVRGSNEPRPRRDLPRRRHYSCDQRVLSPFSSPAREVSFVGGKIPRIADSVGAAPSAPRSGPLAATLFGGLRPWSLRVHDPCNQHGHGSCLGFPGRRQPRGPAASGNVARGLQVLSSGEEGSASLAGSRVAAPVGLTMRTRSRRHKFEIRIPKSEMFTVIGNRLSVIGRRLR